MGNNMKLKVVTHTLLEIYDYQGHTKIKIMGNNLVFIFENNLDWQNSAYFNYSIKTYEGGKMKTTCVLAITDKSTAEGNEL